LEEAFGWTGTVAGREKTRFVAVIGSEGRLPSPPPPTKLLRQRPNDGQGAGFAKTSAEGAWRRRNDLFTHSPPSAGRRCRRRYRPAAYAHPVDSEHLDRSRFRKLATSKSAGRRQRGTGRHFQGIASEKIDRHGDMSLNWLIENAQTEQRERNMPLALLRKTAIATV
jgi:hypothetical protein